MNRLYFIFVIMFSFLTIAKAQKYTISGTIRDAKTGETLIGANVFNGKTFEGTTSNVYGFYSLTQESGDFVIKASFVGYQSFEQSIALTGDIKLDIVLESAIEQLDVVEIKGTKGEKALKSTQMSVNTISVKTMKSLPVLMGEVDVIKAIQLLPGVQSGSEGSSGLYVRGGGADQNLILLDGVPVYNANHLFGFFSVFNADAINSVSLIKGGFPARFGGRLSSVLDIRMKEGNMKTFHGEGSIGLISSKLTLEGPIIKDRTSFIISGRRTYIDILAQPFIRMQNKQKYVEDFGMGYYFYDLNAKVNHVINSSNRLFLSAYTGKDKAYYHEKYKYSGGNGYSKNDFALYWGNLTTALRWNSILSPKLFCNSTLTYSRYKFVTGLGFEELDADKKTEVNMDYSSGIDDWAGHVDFDYIPSTSHYIRFGAGAILHTFYPGITAYKNSGNGAEVDTTVGNHNIKGNEFSVYFEDDVVLSESVKMNIGLHYSGFKVGKSYYSALEPRVSARWLVNGRWSVKAAYTKMQQYIHLLSNSGVGLPNDLWLPVTDKVKPQTSHQVALGTVYQLTDEIEMSVEGFYKSMDNLIEYKEGASYLSQRNDWQDKIEQGEGWAYGMEVLLRKSVGNTMGWIGYTLSWSERKFENISGGKVFPYKYDRRHDVSVALTHKFSEKIDVGIAWVYGTGNGMTLGFENFPSLETNDHQNLLTNIEKRNNYRMPSYHRLDISAGFHKKKRWGERTWSISVYNAYNRQNPFFLYWGSSYNKETNKDESKLKQVSLFPVIPAITYSFKF